MIYVTDALQFAKINLRLNLDWYNDVRAQYIEQEAIFESKWYNKLFGFQYINKSLWFIQNEAKNRCKRYGTLMQRMVILKFYEVKTIDSFTINEPETSLFYEWMFFERQKYEQK